MADWQFDLDPSLENLPVWKRDLILRKRANAKSQVGLTISNHGGKPTRSTHTPQMLLCSIPGNSQLYSRSRQGPTEDFSSSRKGRNNSDNQCSARSVLGYCSRSYRDKVCNGTIASELAVNLSGMKDPETVMQGKINMANGSSHLGSEDGSGPGCADSGDDTELEYGPGIVSRLKDRYMSIAMREAKGRTSLRKYNSLEDLLDEGPSWTERGRSVQKSRPLPNQVRAKKDVMKRARSVDSLALRSSGTPSSVPKSLSSGALRHVNLDALGKEDVIIIETSPPVHQNGLRSMPNSRCPMPNGTSSWKMGSTVSSEGDAESSPTVKNVKQIFESSSGRHIRGAAAKVALYKAAQARKLGGIPSRKPAIKAKPPQLMARKAPESTPESSNFKPVVIQSSPRPLLNIKPPTPPIVSNGANSPVGLTPIVASVTSPYLNGTSTKIANSVTTSTSSQNSVTTSTNSQNSQELYNFIKRTAAVPKHSNEIRPRPYSPVTVLPPSPISFNPEDPFKSINGEHRCSTEDIRVLKENQKNSEKSFPPSVVLRSPPSSVIAQSSPISPKPKMPDPPATSPIPRSPKSPDEAKVQPSREIPPFPSSEPTSAKTTKRQLEYVPKDDAPPGPNAQVSSSLLEVIRAADLAIKSQEVSPQKQPSFHPRENRWHQQENASLVFNFSKRTDTPDYIENDGVDLSQRIQLPHHDGYLVMPGFEGKLDSSTDDFEDDLDSKGNPTTPCNFEFEGAAVIINGRSNLQRQPRTKKLEISFDMASTSTFEYPSENSLLEDYLAFEGRHCEDNLAFEGRNCEDKLVLSPGGLGNYMPNKLHFHDVFELGISRTALPPTPPREKPPSLLHSPLEDHLRPAGDSEIIAWSSERAPDMLF